MSSNVRREYLLENLDCANCAAKIQREVGFVQGIENSSLDFVTKKLVIEFQKEEDSSRIYQETWRIVKKFEPEVELIDLKDDKKKNQNISNSLINEGNKGEVIKLAIGAFLFGTGMILKVDRYMEFVLFFISYILVGGEVLIKAFNNIRRGQIFDENFLMAIATIGAFAIGQFPEGVSVMIFYQIGEFLQNIAVNNSRRSVTSLMSIKPDYANLIVGKLVQRVNPEKVMVGDFIIVKPGEKVPLDGIILDGISNLDTSALTGESMPREVKPGDRILSGCININGLLKIKVSNEFAQSTVSKILDLVQNASSRKAPTENFITQFARYYTPVVVVIAGFLAVIPPIIISGATFSEWIYRALAFLVVSCPCALVISIPLGFFGGIGSASKHGILIKGSNYLEALNKVKTVVFDKTGTLTKGVFKVVKINLGHNITEEELLRYAAYAESFSNHPIATSILNAYGKEIDKNNIEKVEEIPGLGIKAKINDIYIYVGNYKLMERENIKYDKALTNETIIHVAINTMYGGNIVIADELKDNSKKLIENLKKLGIERTVMLTGDNISIGEAVATVIGIDEFYGELLPLDKVDKIEILQKQQTKKEKLVFVGDGINDAPVLARADIGIAMGGLGSDAAIEAADIVIMNDDPIKIGVAIKIANKTRQIVWQNIIFAIGVKLMVLTLVAGGKATMWEAVFADVGVALLAILNSMRVMGAMER